jgi:hypothetical protein
MTLRAVHGCVLASQRISRLLVKFDGEDRRLKLFFRMTGLAILSLELTSVRIGRMAICAVRKSDLPLEIIVFVAFLAGTFDVRAMQRKFGLRMIEARRQLGNMSPPRSRMAVLAWRRESAPVRIFVAVRAGAEWEIFVNHHGFRRVTDLARAMALFTSHLFVQSGQQISRALMIEAGGLLPALHGVAVSAVGAQLPAMDVGVAGGALLRESEIRAIQVLHPNAGMIEPGNDMRVVASVAGKTCMLSNQRITGLPMIEFRGRRFPLDDVEVNAVVLGVAPRTVFNGSGTFDHRRVIPVSRREALPDLLVAAQTLQAGRSGTENMARAAVGRPAQVIVRLRERTWRDLRQNRQSAA